MSKLEMLTKLNDICLFVKDFQGALKFYTEKFGFKVKRLQPDPEHANYAEFEFHGTGDPKLYIPAGLRKSLSCFPCGNSCRFPP